MKCPHCNTAANLEETSDVGRDDVPGKQDAGYEIASGHCSECGKLIVIYRTGTYQKFSGSVYLADQDSETIIFPRNANRFIDAEVPEPYRTDYLEAAAVLSLSPKASAALSRRILQTVLREELNIKRPNLITEINEFISRPGIPSYLSEAVDAVRNIGNFAAHPLKDTYTGAIVDVEPGEAEWLLEALDSLFDFVFVQPKRIQERRNRLNQKLGAMGKPPMK